MYLLISCRDFEENNDLSFIWTSEIIIMPVI